MNYSAILKQAIEKYGQPSQVDKAIEEMAELTKALMKDRYKGIWRNGTQESLAVIEEIADVEILLFQLKFIYQCNDQVEVVKKRKIERLASELN